MEENTFIEITAEEGVEMPVYATDGSVGFDLRVNKVLQSYKSDKPATAFKVQKMQQGFSERGFIKIRPFERILFGTGVFVKVPDGMELQIRPRSGACLKRGLTVLNSPGTIDSDYRGEVGVIIYNSTPFLTEITFNERLAQGVVNKIVKVMFLETKELSPTERGDGGFGSTGQ